MAAPSAWQKKSLFLCKPDSLVFNSFVVVIARAYISFIHFFQKLFFRSPTFIECPTNLSATACCFATLLLCFFQILNKNEFCCFAAFYALGQKSGIV